MASVTLSLRSAQKKCQRYKIVCPQFVYFIKPFNMFLIAVVSAILAVTNADPLGCCTPSRYSGLLQEIGGALKENSTTAIAIDDMQEIHFDYSKRMQTIINRRYDDDQDRRVNTTIIYDYLNGREYIVTHDGKCYTSALNPNSLTHPCFSKNMTYGDTYTVGSSKNRFQVNTFSGVLGNFRIDIALTADHCYPVADKLYFNTGEAQTVLAFLFMNIDPNGVNDALFSVPSICNTAGPIVGKRDLELEVLGLKRRPFTYE